MGILLWPFKLVFWLTGLVLSLCSKLITLILGLAVCEMCIRDSDRTDRRPVSRASD